MQTADHFALEGIIVVRCPGRLRIKVPALYRSPAEKRRIEAALSAHENISQVFANPLTGKVLILFDISIPADDILPTLGLRMPRPAAENPGIQESDAAQRQAVPAPAPQRTWQSAEPVPVHEIYPPWHLREADAAVAFHGSSRHSGLAVPIAEHRLRHGHNLLPQPRARTSLEILLDQFKNLPVLLLGVSAALSVMTGAIPEAFAIVAVLAMNGGIGFVTERRAESTDRFIVGTGRR
jgi:P-type Ca2+ transporter type 2C